MERISQLLNQPKSRKLAILMALLMAIFPLPVAGLHKFYLGQPIWGIIYLLLWNTPMPRIACAIDAVWYWVQGEGQFNRQFNSLPSSAPNALPGTAVSPQPAPQPVGAMAEALRELDRLREEGLVSEYEFEQKRRQLLDRLA